MSTLYIFFGAQIAEAVRGASREGHTLEPILLADGATFVLPANVLADPGHASRSKILCTLPQREVGPEEWQVDPKF